tara:strand:- start:1018 stop:1239 length:222 start_codon:yes stop_codon:yes gene_type:complete
VLKSINEIGEMIMLLERTSMISNKTTTMELPITNEQLDRWRQGELIQNVFSDLTPDQREFIMTGITAEEWRTL